MQAIQVKCPNCAAILRVSADAMVVNCDYCHTQSHIQRRTWMLQRPVPMPPTRGAARGTRPARQVVKRSMVALSALLGIAPLLAVGAALVAIQGGPTVEAVKSLVEPITTAVRATGTASDDRGDQGSWVGLGPPVFIDVDGDQVADVIGRVRYVHDGDRAHIVARSGKTGERLWQSDALGTYGSTIQGRTVPLDDVLLFTDGTGALTGLDLAKGTTRFKAALSDQAERFCRRGEGAVLIVTADGNWHELSLADGALRRVRKEPRCDRIRHDERGEVDPAVSVDESPRRSSQAGMRLDRELRRGRGPVVAPGSRSPGTSVPMIAGLDARGRVTWKAEVPDGKPLEARQSGRGLWTVTDHHVCTTYERTDSSRAPHLTCFALASGARAWDIQLPTGSTPLTSLAAQGERLYLSGWGVLLGIDAASGAWLPGFGR